MRYREFVEHTKAAVRRVGKGFTHPDDDWAPILIADFPGEGPRVMPLPWEAFESPEGKDALAVAVAAACRIETPTKIAFVSSTWMVKFNRDRAEMVYRGDTEEPPPSQHPRRIEAVMVNVVDAERVEVHLAPIKRRVRLPPTLGPWESMPEDLAAGTGYTGRFIDLWREALR